MKYSVVRDHRSQGDFTPAGQNNPIHYDNHLLHVLYTDVDGKPSVDKLKIRHGLMEAFGIKEDLAGKDIDIEYGPNRNPVNIRVIGYRNK